LIYKGGKLEIWPNTREFLPSFQPSLPRRPAFHSEAADRQGGHFSKIKKEILFFGY